MLLENTTYTKLRKMSFVIFFCCLVAIFFSGFDTILAKTRDIKRRADIKILTKALDLYHNEYGYYPDSANDWYGWDLTYKYKDRETGFLKIIKDKGLIDKTISDPINNANHYYRYQKYPAGSFGCEKSFYILQIISFELPTKNIGQGECPELNWVESAANGYTIQVFD